MGAEPAYGAAALGGGLVGVERLLDALPTPLLLVEQRTARVLFANGPARELAGGGELPVVQDAARGQPFADLALNWETLGGLRSLRVAGEPLTLAGGERVTVVTLEDVTDLQRASARAALLAEAGARLAGSLDYEETLAAVADVVVPAYADWCFVELLRASGGIERVLMQHADPEKRRAIVEYDGRYPLDPNADMGSARVIRTGEPELLEEIPPEFLERAATDSEQLQLLREAGLRSSLCVPMRVRGTVVGDIALVYAESGRRFAAEDVPVVQALADRCALALDNARLFTELREAETTARLSRDELRATLEAVADAVTVQGRDTRLIYANTAAARMYGLESPEAMLSVTAAEYMRRFEILDEEGAPLDIERLPGRRALAGEDAEPLTVVYRDRETGERRWSRIKATPVRDDSGDVRLAVNVVEDVTELKRSEQAQRFLAEASRALASSLDTGATLNAVARLAVPDIADWCVVDLAGDDGRERVAVAHVDPQRLAFAEELQRRYPPRDDEDSGVSRVLRTGESILAAEISEAEVRASAIDAEHARLLGSLGIRSAMLVPLRIRERVLGVITLIAAESGRRYDEHDLELAEDLGLRAAVAVENSRLYDAASRIGRTLQTSLLPPDLPDVPGLELAADYRPAGEGLEVGGDFYDVFSTAEDQWYALVGDVCGKGAEAAAVTAMARYSLRTAAVRRRSPAAILRWLSDAMLRQADARGRFATIALAHLDVSRSPVRVTVACGGHPLPAVLRADGSVERIGQPGTLLGLLGEPELQDRSGELCPGDTLVLYTDGLTEARAPRAMWTPDDLAATLRAGPRGSAAGVVEHLVGAALGGVPAPRDDVAVLALRAAG